jgi:hypothetical protein
MREWQRYLPAVILGFGCLLLGAGNTQQVSMSLAAPLATLPREIDGLAGSDREISEAEQKVAGMSS